MPQKLINSVASSLSAVYQTDEAKIVAREIVSRLFELSPTSFFALDSPRFSPKQQAEADNMIARLLKHEPLQYVLGEAMFYGRRIKVNKSVLIPRPETEELVGWIIENSESKKTTALSILDIGTGSGAIAISLAAELADAKVDAVDISLDALDVATENARCADVDVKFYQCDILTAKPQDGSYDIIVSNPPYVMEKEKQGMESNVLDYEPDVALFVPDDNPLLFYKAIASYADKALKPGGELYFEINSACGQEMVEMLTEKGFTEIALRKDLYGLDRMIKAVKKRT